MRPLGPPKANEAAVRASTAIRTAAITRRFFIVLLQVVFVPEARR
jgi:hypothetical protein